MLNANPVKAKLWHSYRFEIFKVTRMQFYRVALTFPAFISLIALIGMTVVRFVNPPEAGVPTLPAGALDLYGWGSAGTFVSAAYNVLNALLTFSTITVVIVASMLIGSEYTNNTVKMLAIRQSSRIKLALSKLMTIATFTMALMLEIALIWFIFGLFFKFFYSIPLEINAGDWQAIGEALTHIFFSGLQMTILGFLAAALTFQYKSIIAGVIGYFLYNLVDAGLSNVLTGIVKRGSGSLPTWLQGLMEMLVPLQPYFLQSNINRLDMQDYIQVGTRTIPNPQIVLSNPVWGAWLLLAAYLLVFGGLAVWIFARRDITD
jgi:ABC-type transport system involved in multi-copper enzyme maturation permease subunit